ncbi:hypothetical protein CEP54_004839 [Fusarium duplospermum]|uniref:Uncharacterized protein n=1 Tax=Fusarium duplospermum TaxID=1325734 RepID=A0A428QFI3_9HYPO|nr:hypothetical protein CEP54_004839 [Fusarium duplospermum]
MAKSEEEGSTDRYKITLSHYRDALKDHPGRRKPIRDVVDLYDRIRKGGNMNDDVQEQFFKDISTTKWSTSLKAAGSKHQCYKALMGNGGRHENRRFSNWVIVSACWPDAEKLPDIRAGMAKYWGLETFPDGEFPKVTDDEQMKLYLGKLDKKHPSKFQSRSKGKGSQKPDQGDDDNDSRNSDFSDGETDDEVMIDEESTKAAQEARDKSLQEESQKTKNSDPGQVDKASGSTGLMTMDEIQGLAKAYADRGAKRPADPTPVINPPPAKRSSTTGGFQIEVSGLSEAMGNELRKQLPDLLRDLWEENRKLREEIDEVKRTHADFEEKTMETMRLLVGALQGQTTSESTEAT